MHNIYECSFKYLKKVFFLWKRLYQDKTTSNVHVYIDIKSTYFPSKKTAQFKGEHNVVVWAGFAYQFTSLESLMSLTIIPYEV